MGPAPLADVQVVDLTTGIAGPYCTKLFADAGAEVVKVEPAGGDPLRGYAASGSATGPTGGPLFRHLNGGKRSVVGDLGTPAVAALLPGADVVVEDGLADAVVARLRADHPHLVAVSITPFGRSGPRAGSPGSDLTVQAEAGVMKFRGRPDRPPIVAGGHVAEYLAGAAAAAPALAAVLRSRRTGQGEHVDVSMHDVMAIAGTNYMDLIDALQGRPPITHPLRFLDTPGVEQTADGMVGVNANTGRMFEMFLIMIERPDLLDVPEVARITHRAAMGAEWQEIVDAWMRRHTTAEVVAIAAELRIPAAPVHDGRSVVDDEQYSARGLFERSADGGLRIRAPYLVDGERPPLRDAPVLDADRDGVEPRAPRRAPTTADPAALPLAGLRVIDLTSWWVGGMATQMLALLGADVIHVESTVHPDGMRLTGAWSGAADWWEYGHVFTAVSAQKRGITLDLGAAEGRGLLHRLIGAADVFVENFTPRVTESFGLGYAEVRSINPAIVHLRMPGFGLTGPWRDRPAFAQIVEPMSTMASITGFPEDRPVAKGGIPDPTAAWHGAWVAVLGIAQHLRTGGPVALEAVMVEAAVNVCPEPALEYAASGFLMGRTGNRSSHVPYQTVVRAAGADEWVAITVADATQADALAAVLGDPGFAPADDPAAADARIGAWALTRDAEAAAATLRAAGVPAARCQDPRKLSEQPHLGARGLFEVVDHPVLGPHPVPAMPCRFASVDRWATRGAPTLGQDNAAVLGGLLGLDAATLDRLEGAGVIGTRPVGL